MNKVNILLTLLSLNALLVTVERFSPTSAILLQPYNFLRLHEVFQMSFVLSISTLISFLLLKVITNNFETLKDIKGTLCGLLFIAGLYFYATGNSLHELSGFILTNYCNIESAHTLLCSSMFFNDFYIGNGVFFFGFLIGNISLILLERRKPLAVATKGNTVITLINSLLFTFALIDYAAFDISIIGLVFSIIAAIIINIIFITSKQKIQNLPFTLYCSFGYTVTAVVSLVIRFHAF